LRSKNLANVNFGSKINKASFELLVSLFFEELEGRWKSMEGLPYLPKIIYNFVDLMFLPFNKNSKLYKILYKFFCFLVQTNQELVKNTLLFYGLTLPTLGVTKHAAATFNLLAVETIRPAIKWFLLEQFAFLVNKTIFVWSTSKVSPETSLDCGQELLTSNSFLKSLERINFTNFLPFKK
jgi:hypothetical protein